MTAETVAFHKAWSPWWMAEIEKFRLTEKSRNADYISFHTSRTLPVDDTTECVATKSWQLHAAIKLLHILCSYGIYVRLL